jgi:hypothetical protein
MALSAAYDRNLSFERRDLERFYGLYEQGPEGVFLKRGKQFRIRLRAAPPFVFIFNSTPEDRTDRVFFGKAMAYSVAVAPFVWLLGMNGFLVFHALLLFIVGLCGYLFLAAHSRPGPALAFVLGFLCVSVVPVYAVILTSDLFNFSLVFIAYFLWLYKEVTAPRFPLGGFPADLAAAVLLGIVTYSKPWHAPLVAPLVLLFWWRRQWRSGFLVGTAAVVVTALLFAANAAISGEFNYQGGDRKTFYSAPDDPQAARLPTAGFPFASPNATWDVRGQATGRNEGNVDNVLAPSEIVRLFPNNVKYFLLGRHFGFVPYFFPGAIAVLLWLLSRERFTNWRVLTFGGVALASLIVLNMVPYTWSGDGGPPAIFVFLELSALFLVIPTPPPLGSALPAFIASRSAARLTTNTGQPVLRGEIHLGSDRARLGPSSARRVDDVPEFAGDARHENPRAGALRPGSLDVSVLSRRARVAARAERHVDLGERARRHPDSHAVDRRERRPRPEYRAGTSFPGDGEFSDRQHVHGVDERGQSDGPVGAEQAPDV